MQNIICKNFTGVTSAEAVEEVNKWLTNNPTIDVVHIQYLKSENRVDAIVLYHPTVSKQPSCANCYHMYKRDFEEPCSICFDWSHWQMKGVGQ